MFKASCPNCIASCHIQSPFSKLQESSGPVGASLCPPPLSPSCCLPQTTWPATGNQRQLSFFREMAQICCKLCQHTNTQTRHPQCHLKEQRMRKKKEERKEGPGGGKSKTSEKICAGPPFSPSLTAAVPTVGAGLGPLWGGNILLSVLCGRRRACSLANLHGEKEGKKKKSMSGSHSPWKPPLGCPHSKPLLSLGHPRHLSHGVSRSSVGLSTP